MKETMSETEVTYTLQHGDKFYIIEHVPARVCKETGEQYFSPETVEHIQELIKGNTLLSLESTGYRMSHLAMNEMFLDRLEPPEELLSRVDAVTTDQVRGLAAEVLRRDRFTLAAVGDLPEGELAF